MKLLPYIFTLCRNIRKGENVGWVSKLYVLRTEEFFFIKYFSDICFLKNIFALSALKLTKPKIIRCIYDALKLTAHVQ